MLTFLAYFFLFLGGVALYMLFWGAVDLIKEKYFYKD